MTALTDRIAEVQRKHREELNEEDVCICGYHGDWAAHVADQIAEALPDAHRQLQEIRDLIAGYREADPPDIGHRIYVDIETILDDWSAVEEPEP